MKIRAKYQGVDLLALCVTLFLLISFVINANLLGQPLQRLAEGEIVFSEFITEVQEAYTKKTAAKEQFVNINGLFVRLIGQRTCNKTIRLNNGMLSDQLETPQEILPLVNNLAQFNQYLAAQGIPFLYVQAPCKLDTEGTLLPYGLTHYANSDADQLLESLAANGVAAFDLRPALSQTAEMVEKNFFRTDHHWTFAAALRAVPMILEQMDSLLPDQTLDTTYAAFDQWEAHTLKNWFLGTAGKRTGVFFGGVDDIVYYTPKFDTQLSRTVLNHRQFFKGDFFQANMDESSTQHRDYYNESPYYVYVGGDYPLVEHRNIGAPNKQKVLLIKDSYTLPLQCYLSTIFQEVDVIDPRYLKSDMGTVAEYVSATQPDIVVMMLYPVGSLGHAPYRNFGVAQELQWEQSRTGNSITLPLGNHEVALSESLYSYSTVGVDLQPGSRYTFRCSKIILADDSADVPCAMAAVYNADKKRYARTHIFDIDFCNQTGGCQWTFTVPADETGNLKLLLYAGLPGETDGVHLTYCDAFLSLET